MKTMRVVTASVLLLAICQAYGLSFTYSYSDVFLSSAEDYLLSQSNVQKVNEGIVHYYSPVATGAPASLTYHFDLSGTVTDASLFAQLASYNFGGVRAGVLADRSQFFKDLTMPFYGYNRPGAKVSEGVRNSFRLQGMMAGFPAAYFCIKAFSETDQTEDLKKFDGPTLIMHGDDDQMVPLGASARQSSKLIKNAQLKVYKGGAGMCTTQKEEVNADLLAFFKA
jgi:pimeloyl-ACP methyl ester carboxylesterase